MPQTSIRLYRENGGRIPLQDWLDRLEMRDPAAFAKCLERILLLEQFGYELRRPATDSLRDGIRELRAKSARVHYRILYFFSGANTACLSHGFTKEGKIPNDEINLAITRKKLVARDVEKYTADWELQDE